MLIYFILIWYPGNMGLRFRDLKIPPPLHWLAMWSCVMRHIVEATNNQLEASKYNNGHINNFVSEINVMKRLYL